jgi:hypothetical protein
MVARARASASCAGAAGAALFSLTSTVSTEGEGALVDYMMHLRARLTRTNAGNLRIMQVSDRLKVLPMSPA